MITRRFKIMAKLFLRQTDSSYVFSGPKGTQRDEVPIPISQVTGYENTDKWITMTVTQWVWMKMDLDVRFEKHKMNERVIVEAETHFDVNWDFVIKRRKRKNFCFFCNDVLHSVNRTKDHLIAKKILKANEYYTKYWLPNNLVPCCKDCNQEKGSMKVCDFRDYVARKVKNNKGERYNIMLNTLDKLLDI